MSYNYFEAISLGMSGCFSLVVIYGGEFFFVIFDSLKVLTFGGSYSQPAVAIISLNHPRVRTGKLRGNDLKKRNNRRPLLL